MTAESIPTQDVRPLVVFVIGGPGSGKGTQSSFLSETYGYEHFSAGDLLRGEQATGSHLAEMIDGCIKQGTIVHAEVTVELLKIAIKKSGKKKFIIDGFPRNTSNLQTWFELMDEHVFVEGILYLTCSEDAMMYRILERGKTSGRADDNKEALRKRFRTYRDVTLPIVDHFAKLDKVLQVNADRDITSISNDLRRLFRYQVVFVIGPSCAKACDHIIAQYPDWCHLCACRFIRNSSDHQNGNEIGDSENTVCSLIHAMEQSGRRFFLISGFPSQATELEAWNKKIDNEKFQVKLCLYLKQDSAEEVALQSTLKQNIECTNNIVGSATGNDVLEYPETTNVVQMQDVVTEKFRAEGLLRQVDISQEAEAVCKYIDFNISSGGWYVNEAQPEGILGS